MSDLKDLSKYFKEIDKELNNSKNKILTQVVKTFPEKIKKRMQSGKGNVEKNFDDATGYKPLKKETIENRKRAKAKGKLSGLTQPEKSNQIYSGDMYNSISGRITSQASAEVGIFDNKIAEYAKAQEDKGRSTLYLSAEEEKVLDKIINEALKKI